MEDILRNVVEHGLKEAAEFVEIRVQDFAGVYVRVVDGKIRNLVNRGEIGAAIRVFGGGAWGFSSTNNLGKQSLLDALKNAVSLMKVAEKHTETKFKLHPVGPFVEHLSARVKERITNMPIEDKIKYAIEASNAAKKKDPKIVSTSSMYGDSVGSVIVCNSVGTYVEEEVSYVSASAVAYAYEHGMRSEGHHNIGVTGGFEHGRVEDAATLGDKAAEKALRLLKAKPAPAGKFYCIFDPHLAGLFIHEAFGHACEADTVLNGESVLEKRMNTQVGVEELEVIDDPTIWGLYGSYKYDSEGTKARKKVLVREGILNEFLQSTETASRMKLEANGSARASGYHVQPIVRMSNTYISPRNWTFEEMLEDIKEGIYAKGMNYGYTDPSKGQFTFKCEEAYLIENGKLSTIFRDAAFTGTILDILRNIDAIGKDVEHMPGICGKGGQSIRITSGGPHIRVKDVVFGGIV